MKGQAHSTEVEQGILLLLLLVLGLKPSHSIDCNGIDWYGTQRCDNVDVSLLWMLQDNQNQGNFDSKSYFSYTGSDQCLYFDNDLEQWQGSCFDLYKLYGETFHLYSANLSNYTWTDLGDRWCMFFDGGNDWKLTGLNFKNPRDPKRDKYGWLCNAQKVDDLVSMDLDAENKQTIICRKKHLRQKCNGIVIGTKNVTDIIDRGCYCKTMKKQLRDTGVKARGTINMLLNNCTCVAVNNEPPVDEAIFNQMSSDCRPVINEGKVRCRHPTCSCWCDSEQMNDTERSCDMACYEQTGRFVCISIFQPVIKKIEKWVGSLDTSDIFTIIGSICTVFFAILLFLRKLCKTKDLIMGRCPDCGMEVGEEEYSGHASLMHGVGTTLRKASAPRGTKYSQLGPMKTTNRCCMLLLFLLTLGCIKPSKAILVGWDDVGQTYTNGSVTLTLLKLHSDGVCMKDGRAYQNAKYENYGKLCCGMKTCIHTPCTNMPSPKWQQKTTGYGWGEGCFLFGENSAIGCAIQIGDGKGWDRVHCSGGTPFAAIKLDKKDKSCLYVFNRTGTMEGECGNVTLSGCTTSVDHNFGYRRGEPPVDVSDCDVYIERWGKWIHRNPPACSVGVSTIYGEQGQVYIQCQGRMGCKAKHKQMDMSDDNGLFKFGISCDINFWSGKICEPQQDGWYVSNCDSKNGICEVIIENNGTCFEGQQKSRGTVLYLRCSGCTFDGKKAKFDNLNTVEEVRPTYDVFKSQSFGLGDLFSGLGINMHLWILGAFAVGALFFLLFIICCCRSTASLENRAMLTMNAMRYRTMP